MIFGLGVLGCRGSEDRILGGDLRLGFFLGSHIRRGSSARLLLRISLSLLRSLGALLGGSQRNLGACWEKSRGNVAAWADGRLLRSSAIM